MNTNVPTTLPPNVSPSAPIGVQILFDDNLYERVKQVSLLMSKAQGITPPHLIGKGEACFAVVVKSLTWQLDPFAVAASTYETPGGKVGYEGKLVQAILENSGRVEGPVTYEHIGDWSKVQGKFEKKVSKKGNEYPAPAWKDADEEGLGVIVRAQVKGEKKPREFTFWLREAYPRNSTLWATRPSQQICYTAVRAFASMAAPGLFMGVPFSTDFDQGPEMKDVTPRPERDPVAPEKDAQTPYEKGREAFHAGTSFRSAPRSLNPAEYEQWSKGWQDASREHHEGGAEDIDDAAEGIGDQDGGDHHARGGNPDQTTGDQEQASDEPEFIVDEYGIVADASDGTVVEVGDERRRALSKGGEPKDGAEAALSAWFKANLDQKQPKAEAKKDEPDAEHLRKLIEREAGNCSTPQELDELWAIYDGEINALFPPDREDIENWLLERKEALGKQ